jgi:hypothetical protein
MDDPIEAVTGTRRSRAEVQALVVWLRELVQDPTDVAALGAMDAAKWTLRQGPAPLTPDRPWGQQEFEAESALAQSVSLELLPGDRERAAGVRAWLSWWLVSGGVPAWLAPPTRRPGR